MLGLCPDECDRDRSPLVDFDSAGSFPAANQILGPATGMDDWINQFRASSPSGTRCVSPISGVVEGYAA